MSSVSSWMRQELLGRAFSDSWRELDGKKVCHVGQDGPVWKARVLGGPVCEFPTEHDAMIWCDSLLSKHLADQRDKVVEERDRLHRLVLQAILTGGACCHETDCTICMSWKQSLERALRGGPVSDVRSPRVDGGGG